MEVIKEVGAIAGLAAFLGLAVLALLYFAQARDVRRLRENAEFLVEGPEGPAVRPADRAAASVATEDPEQAAAAAAAGAPDEREAFRRAELARQAAERRQRFEQRRRPGSGLGGGQRPAWLQGGASTAIVAVGALLLIAGVAFGATQLLGGDDDESSGGGGVSRGEKPASTKVAVLNGTAEAGLASQAAAPLKAQNYVTGPVTNTEQPFEASVVMFDPNAGAAAEESARQVAQIAAIEDVQPMTTEIRGVSEGAAVAVVLGEDQVSGASSTEGTETTSGVDGI
jgi:LytR cell envelope-related transcriptional attenuator